MMIDSYALSSEHVLYLANSREIQRLGLYDFPNILQAMLCCLYL